MTTVSVRPFSPSKTPSPSAAGSQSPGAVSPLTSRRFGLFMTIALVGLLADLVSKTWIFDRLGMPGREGITIIDGILSLETQLNEGALFSLGQGYQWFFSLLSVVAVVFILVWLFVKGAARDLWLTVALAMVMSGVLGNLWDRLGVPALRWNYPPERIGEPVRAVRDWIHFQIAAIGFDWPVFNIADSLLVCGAILLAWHAVRSEMQSDSPGERDVESTSAPS